MKSWKLGKIRFGGTSNAFWKRLDVRTVYGLDWYECNISVSWADIKLQYLSKTTQGQKSVTLHLICYLLGILLPTNPFLTISAVNVVWYMEK